MLRKLLLIFIFLILTLPLLQYTFSFIEENSLNGSYKLKDKPSNHRMLKNLLAGNFQIEYELYFNDHFGFRNFFVKVFNQTQYSFFNKTSAKDVEIGKEAYLYERGYIRDYMGTSFVGKEKIIENLKRIKKIQKELYQYNINLILCFAPGKASHLPEFFPIKYDTSLKTLSNYLYYIEQSKHLELNYIDFNEIFLNHKKKSNIKLFPKGGVHWGEYGVALAFDSLSSYVERKFDIQMSYFTYDEIKYPNKLDFSDRDISDAMNLLFEYPAYKMPKPIYSFKNDSTLINPKLLIIGDSYGYGMTNSPIINNLFSTVEFWYYNKEIKPKRANHSNKVENINVKEELKKFDIVLLMSTETNLYKFDFGFSESYFNEN